MKVIDSFMFFNEFDILKLRLEYLNDVVDHFIISECNYTHSAKPKPYYLDEIFDDIPEEIRRKIIRLKYEPDISQFNFLDDVTECDFDNGNWKIERSQRNYITEQLKSFSSNDLFMISDADEIPRKEVIQNIISNYQSLGEEFIYAAKCDMFYYNFSTFSTSDWSGTVFSNVRTTLKYGCDYFRSNRFQLSPIENGGWHFSYFGDVEKIKIKLQSFAHQEFNKEKYLNDLNIVEAIENKKDLLQRGQNFNQFNFLDYPDNLRFSIERIFPSEFYKTPNYMSITSNFNHNLIEATPFNPYIEERENTKNEYSSLIKTSFLKSIQENTKLPDWIILLNGMSGKRYRIFINNLIETMQDARYLEIGSWSGSTICSAIYKNKVNSVCIDNWSQFGDVKDEFTKNVQNTLKDGGQNGVRLYEQDFRKIDYTSIGKFNVYFFDGPHEIDDQYDGLKYALPALDDTFIFIVDDWNNPCPREGTERVIKDLGIEVIYSIQIRTTNGIDKVYPEIDFQDSHWHNGYFISVCKKNSNKKNNLNKMKDALKTPSGATETSYLYLNEHYTFPENVFVSHLPEEIKKSNHQYKILWAHHAYDQPVFLNFDHNTVDHIVSPSQWNKDQLIRFLNVPEHKITVIPNGVAEMFQHSTQKTKTMIFTSIPYKGLEVLSKVIPLISKVHKDVKFKIFSSMSLYGPSNDQFIELYEYLKTLPNVEYSPVIDREELVKHYQESAFFIHPNIWEETFGVSMIEAMKCGAYPIITDIGALAEVAGEKNATVVPIEGENTSKGWKVTDNFIRQFANACCLALDYYDKEPQFYQEVSKLISDYVTEKYDWKKIAEQWRNLINTISGNSLFFRENTLDRWIYDEVYTNNSYQIGTLETDDVVIDIGSHCGYFGKLCLDKGSKNVLLYEPDKGNYNLLMKNLSEYNGWKAHNVAVWKEETDDLQFHTYSEYKNTGLNSVFKSPYIEPSEITRVQSITLDSILSTVDKVKVLKIDAEGSEYDILMNSTLLKKVETIVGEYHNDLTDKSLDDLRKFLNSKNFDMYQVIPSNEDSGTFFARNIGKVEPPPVYYCMTSTKSTEKYTEFALKSFFQNTQLRKQDKFFLIDNDGQYSLADYRENITLIANNTPKTFAENMNFVMKLALIDGVDFFGLSNDVVFTENWNQNFNSTNTVLVPLCNQKMIGECGSLKIETAMDLEDIQGKEHELNKFVRSINVQPDLIDTSMIGFYCFYIPHNVISRVGFLDENFRNGAEDTDYRLRVEQLGFNVGINYNSYLIHFCGKSTWRSGEDKKKTVKRYTDYKDYFTKKWGVDLADKCLVKM